MKVFKLKTLFLTIFITLLSQTSIAQNNATETTIRIGNLEIQRSAINSGFYLSEVVWAHMDPLEYVSGGYERTGDIYSQHARPFLDAGLRVEALHRYRITPLIYAIVHEDTEAVDSLVQEAGINYFLPDSHGMTPLMWAAVVSNEDIFRSLFTAVQADVMAQEIVVTIEANWWPDRRVYSQEFTEYMSNIMTAYELAVDAGNAGIANYLIRETGVGGSRGQICYDFSIWCH